jgi:anti-sigma28 factor (negative regulator of flagellin synthesis)
MRAYGQIDSEVTVDPNDLTRIARPESVVILAATVRAAREQLRQQRIAGLKERVSEGGYTVSSKDLAARVLSTNV